MTSRAAMPIARECRVPFLWACATSEFYGEDRVDVMVLTRHRHEPDARAQPAVFDRRGDLRREIEDDAAEHAAVVGPDQPPNRVGWTINAEAAREQRASRYAETSFGPAPRAASRLRDSATEWFRIVSVEVLPGRADSPDPRVGVDRDRPRVTERRDRKSVV